MKRMFDEYDLQRSLTAAVKCAEERFARDYHNIDAELTVVLIAQTRFADVPSVHSAIKEMLTHPFQDPIQTVTTLRRSYGVLSYGYRHLLWSARAWAYQPDTTNRC